MGYDCRFVLFGYPIFTAALLINLIQISFAHYFQTNVFLFTKIAFQKSAFLYLTHTPPQRIFQFNSLLKRTNKASECKIKIIKRVDICTLLNIILISFQIFGTLAYENSHNRSDSDLSFTKNCTNSVWILGHHFDINWPPIDCAYTITPSLISCRTRLYSRLGFYIVNDGPRYN